MSESESASQTEESSTGSIVEEQTKKSSTKSSKKPSRKPSRKPSKKPTAKKSAKSSSDADCAGVVREYQSIFKAMKKLLDRAGINDSKFQSSPSARKGGPGPSGKIRPGRHDSMAVGPITSPRSQFCPNCGSIREIHLSVTMNYKCTLSLSFSLFVDGH